MDDTRLLSKARRALIPALVVLYFVINWWWYPLPAVAENACGETYTPITAVRGEGSQPQRLNDWVTTEAVVTADFTGEDSFGGFFIQQSDEVEAEADGSRGLFVFARDADVNPGERVRLRGRVGLHGGLAQLHPVRIEARCGEEPLPRARELALPLEESERLALQGMQVTLNSPLVVTGSWHLARYGTLKLADERLMMPTQVLEPGAEAAALWSRQEDHLIYLDDGSRRQRPDPIPYPPPGLSGERTVRVGDQVTALDAILDYRYDEWRLQPLSQPQFKVVNQRPAPPPGPEQGQLRIAAFNVENYFIGREGFPTPRGAANPRELTRQQGKLFPALEQLSAHLIGVVEVGNDGFDDNSSIASLAHALSDDWHWARPESRERLGTDVITQGILYRSERLEPVGDVLTSDASVFDWGNRPPFIQRFRDRKSDRTLLVSVNHFKSKRCGNAEGDNAEQPDGQSCWVPLRVAAADALIERLREVRVGDEPVLVLGDLNAYAREEPLQRLEDAGFENLIEAHVDESPLYSFVYRGRSGTLDYVLGAGLGYADIVAAGRWPINADEPAVLDYELSGKRRDQQQSLYLAAPWRSSDHDPLWLDLEWQEQAGKTDE